MQQPFNFYFNSTNNFNEYFHSVDSEGALWLYIRNSGGEQPYLNMTGSLKYQVFIIQSKMMQVANDENVDMRSMAEFEKFLVRHGHEVTRHSVSR
ncbi:MAG: hypothetical protein QM724_05320 [Flavobacteriales bacterium]